MNPDDLDRLFRAAAAQAPGPAAEPPPGLETRVLAHWRAAQREEESGSLLWATLFRRALYLAGGVALASLLLNFDALTRYPESVGAQASEISVADSAFRLAMTP